MDRAGGLGCVVARFISSRFWVSRLCPAAADADPARAATVRLLGDAGTDRICIDCRHAQTSEANRDSRHHAALYYLPGDFLPYVLHAT